VSSSKRKGRSPGMLYGALSGVLVLLIAALTVTSSRNGPPLIAEYAPSAVLQIKDAPNEQSSNVGSAEGGESDEGGATSTTVAGSSPGATTTTTEPPIERARVRRCVGSPPRQTEDPQSPPCVAFWAGGSNGGSTWGGVTSTQINVAVPTTDARALADLEAYFNNRYEFYGRKLKLTPASKQDVSTCQERKAGAAEDVVKFNVFAGLAANDGNAGLCYNSELARQKRMSVASGPQYAEVDMQAYRPYLWQYTMGNDEAFAALGEMVCARLGTKPANHTPDPLLRGQPRTYGVVLQNVIRDFDITAEPLVDAMAKCGANVKPEHVFRLSTNDDAGLENPQASDTAVLRLKQDGVTTVVNLGIVFVEQYIPTAADRQQYYPEWLFTTYGGNDLNLGIHTFWPQATQRQTIMGLTLQAPMRPYENDPSYLAMKEVDPSIDYNANLGTVSQFWTQYHALLVLASGMQMAGPNLTPENFERALQRTDFPYPAVDPTVSGDVGFKGDHSMTDDAAEFWWSETTPSPIGAGSDGSSGTICYTRNSARVVPGTGTWPKDGDPFLNGPCFRGPGA
jgi:hypothetical protein